MFLKATIDGNPEGRHAGRGRQGVRGAAAGRHHGGEGSQTELRAQARATGFRDGGRAMANAWRMEVYPAPPDSRCGPPRWSTARCPMWRPRSTRAWSSAEEGRLPCLADRLQRRTGPPQRQPARRAASPRADAGGREARRDVHRAHKGAQPHQPGDGRVVPARVAGAYGTTKRTATASASTSASATEVGTGNRSKAPPSAAANLQQASSPCSSRRRSRCASAWISAAVRDPAAMAHAARGDRRVDQAADITSGSKPTTNIRLATEGAEKVKKDFEAVGAAGEAAQKRIKDAATAASPELQKLAGAADIANRAFAGMGGSLGASAMSPAACPGWPAGSPPGSWPSAPPPPPVPWPSRRPVTPTPRPLAGSPAPAVAFRRRSRSMKACSGCRSRPVSPSPIPLPFLPLRRGRQGDRRHQRPGCCVSPRGCGRKVGTSPAPGRRRPRPAVAVSLQALASGVLQATSCACVENMPPQVGGGTGEEFYVASATSAKMGEGGQRPPPIGCLRGWLKAAEDIGPRVRPGSSRRR